MMFTPKNKHILGLDLGHAAIKAAVLETSTTGWHIAKYASAPTPPDTIKDGVVIDPETLGAVIKQLLKENHFHSRTASISVSGGTVVVRPIRIPKMNDNALRKTLKLEASRYIPNSIEESYIDFEIVGPADENNMDVLIAAAPRDVTESRIAACEVAGLDVVAVEVGAFATFRSLVEADLSSQWDDKTVAILDFGATFTHITVVSKGRFTMTRSIQAGSHLLTAQLQSYFKLSEEDAESGKSQLDVSSLVTESKPAENPPLRVLQPLIDDLVREVRRSINYWQSQVSEVKGNKQIDLILLCGGGAKLKGLDQYFTNKLSIETQCIGVMNNPRFFSNCESLSGTGLEVGHVIGLAMGAAKMAGVTTKLTSPRLTASESSEEVAQNYFSIVKSRKKKPKLTVWKQLNSESNESPVDDLPIPGSYTPPSTSTAVDEFEKAGLQDIPEISEFLEEAEASAKPKLKFFGRKQKPVKASEEFSFDDGKTQENSLRHSELMPEPDSSKKQNKLFSLFSNKKKEPIPQESADNSEIDSQEVA